MAAAKLANDIAIKYPYNDFEQSGIYSIRILFNVSSSTGTIPYQFKVAKAVLVYRKKIYLLYLFQTIAPLLNLLSLIRFWKNIHSIFL